MAHRIAIQIEQQIPGIQADSLTFSYCPQWPLRRLYRSLKTLVEVCLREEAMSRVFAMTDAADNISGYHGDDADWSEVKP